MQTSDLGITYPNADTDGFDEVVLGAAFQKVNDLLKGILSVSAGGVIPACRAYNTAAISIANNASTALTFDSERFDTDTIHDLAVNTSRLTCKTAGIYAIAGSIEWAFNATGYRQLLIRLNGATLLAAQGSPALAASFGNDLQVDTIYKLAVNDFVELLAYQTSGGALNVAAAGNFSPEFAMVRVG